MAISTASPPVLVLPPGTWQITSGHRVGFHVKTFWGTSTVEGDFATYDGTLKVDATGTAEGELVVHAATLDTKNAKRDEHLRSAEFFDVDQYPHIRFTVAALTARPGGATITGDLHVGPTKTRLQLPVTIDDLGTGHRRLQTTISVPREQVGLAWNKAGMIRGDAHLNVDVVVAPTHVEDNPTSILNRTDSPDVAPSTSPSGPSVRTSTKEHPMPISPTAKDRLAGTWNFAPVHSSADFSIKYLVAKFRGRFEELDAALTDGVLTGAVKVASIDVKDPNLAGHLMSAEFFDAETNPDITFSSQVLDIDGDTLTLDGELTMKGVTRPVHATGNVEGPTEDFMGNTRLGFTLETTVNRTDYGVSWNADLPKGGRALSDEVKLVVELEFHKG